MAKYDINLRDYWRIIRKRRNIVILATIIFAAFSYLFALFSVPGPLYRATSAVKVEKATDLTTLLLGTVSWTTWDNVATQAVIITSFPVMERAAREMGLIPPTASSAEVRSSSKYLQIINALKSQVETEQEGNTNIVNITATSATPGEAALLANTIAEVFRQSNVEERNKKVRETREFIENQLHVVQERLEGAEQKLRNFEERTELVAIDTQTEAVLLRLTGLEDDISKLQHRRLEVQQNLGSLRQVRAGTQVSQEALYVEQAPPELAKLFAKFRDLSLRRKVLLNEYTEAHPEVKELDAELRNVLSEMENELVSMLSTMDVRLSDLRKSLQAVRAHTMTIPESALTLARMQRDVDVNADLLSQLKSKYQEVLIQESGLIEEVRIVKPALEPSRPVDTPNTMMNTFIGGIIGLLVGLVLALIVETMDTSLGTIEDVEEILGIPVLGVIPSTEEIAVKEKAEDGPKLKSGPLVTHFAPRSPVAEGYRSLRTNLQFIRTDKKAKVFLVSSASLQEGKTYNAVNLSLSLAQAGEKVLLIDADLRRPTVHQIFGLGRQPGLTDCIMGMSDLETPDEIRFEPGSVSLSAAEQPVSAWRNVTSTITDLMLGELDVDDILQTPGLDNLHIIKAGRSFLNPAEILRSPRFKEFLREVREFYDVIMIDTPPALTVADAFEVAPEADGVVLVYEVGRIGRGILKRAKVQFENIHANVLGVILNNVKPDVAPDLYPYRYDYYYGGEGEKVRSAPPRRWWELIGQPLGWLFSSMRLAPATQKKHFSILLLVLAAGFLLTVGLVRKNYSGPQSAHQKTMDVTARPAIATGHIEANAGSPSTAREAKLLTAAPDAAPEIESDTPEQVSLAKAASTTTSPLSQHPGVANKHMDAKSVIAAEMSPASAALASANREAKPLPAAPDAAPEIESDAPEQVSLAKAASTIPAPLPQPQGVAKKSRAVRKQLFSVLEDALICQSLPLIAKVRSGPDISAPVLQRIRQGTRLRVVSIEGDWLKLKLKYGRTGWIYHSLVQGVDFTPPPAQATTEPRPALQEQLSTVLDRALICQSLPLIAKIRSKPDIHAPVLQRIGQGTRLRVVSIEGNWLKLELRNGGTGWIYRRLVQGVDLTPQPRPAAQG